jgi:hypothetical protein
MSDGSGIPTVSNGRNGRGQFARGNPGGPGNPSVRRLGDLQAAVRDAVTPEKLREVLDKLQSMAMEGDVSAARLWLERVLGRATHNVVIEAPVPSAAGPEVPATKKFCQDMIAAHELLDEVSAKHGTSMCQSDEAKLAIEIAQTSLARIEAQEAACDP